MSFQRSAGGHIRRQKTANKERPAGRPGGATTSAKIIVLGGVRLDDAQIFGKHQVSERPPKWTYLTKKNLGTERITFIPRLPTSTQVPSSYSPTQSTFPLA